MVSAVQSGCGEPVTGRQVDPTPNAFHYEATFHGATGRERHTWRISGDRAVVAWEGTALERGVVEIVLEDAAGVEVYSERAGAQSVPAQGVTERGEPGQWTVTVRYTDAEGHAAVAVTGYTG
ncbi:MAG: hypothetical protein D6729_07515 [Deltaproteobacteria bacterium]|nr:MAG: hypothetical protein D6729_07515 [Deltaproteobacteria bacterium]